MVLFERSEFTILADEARNSLDFSPLGAFRAPPLLCVQMGWQEDISKPYPMKKPLCEGLLFL
jgi:hypothetical protein